MNIKSLELEIHLAVGRLYRRRGLEEAERRLHRVLEIDPDCLEAYLEIGYRHFFRHDYERAIQMLQKAATVGGGDVRPYATMADAFFALGREEEGLQAYEKALQIDSNAVV